MTPLVLDIPDDPAQAAAWWERHLTGPDLGRLVTFVGRCRNPDGGYGPTPGKPSTASATYNASIVLHWAGELERR